MISSVLERFHRYLKSHGMRITGERDEILRFVYGKNTHFTATHLHEELQARGHNIGLATIYRNLPHLVRAGIIREAERRRSKEEQTYEQIIGDEHHDHLICELCGDTIEFEEPRIETLQEEVAKKYGFRLRRHFLELRGVCETCQQKLIDDAVKAL